MPGNQTTSQSAARRPVGRPRSQAARHAILDTAYSLLKRKPLAEITMVQIARKAGVSTATLYRWWRTQEALLFEAFMHKTKHVVVLSAKGRPLDRLHDYVMQTGRFFIGEDGIVVARLLAAIQDNSFLRKEFARQILTPRRREARALVRQLVQDRQLPAGADADLFLETILGPLLIRLLLRHEQLSEKYIRAVCNYGMANAAARA